MHGEKAFPERGWNLVLMALVFSSTTDRSVDHEDPSHVLAWLCSRGGR